jgi:uncharacterized membrane protein YeaQ/YmgE (transglycosylase-associated protein family)
MRPTTEIWIIAPVEETNVWNLPLFALIGLLAGAAARMFYPERQPTQIMGTLVLGMVGALVGGMLSWIWWPVVEGQFQSGNLFLSLLGAMTVIVISACVAYARRVSDSQSTS